MNKKKLIAILTLVCFMFTLVPVAAMAEGELDYSSDVAITIAKKKYDQMDNNLFWYTGADITKDSVYAYLLSNGENTYVLHVVGEGDMAFRKNVSAVPWGSYANEITVGEVHEGITHLGARTFATQENLTEVSLPASLKSIGDVAIHRTGITSINLPSNLEEIGTNAVSILGQTKDLQGIVGNLLIPENVITIKDFAFQNNPNLTNIELPDGLTSLGSGVFKGTGLISIPEIPQGISSLSSTFMNCVNITDVTIPNHITTLNSVFSGCTGLTGIVKIPKTVTKYTNSNTNTGLFSSTNIEKVIIESTAPIGNAAFKNCKNLKIVVISDDVTEIGNHAFYGCTSLGPNIYLPNISTIGTDAFKNCTALTGITYCQTGKKVGNCKAVAYLNGGIFITETVFETNELATPIKDGHVFKGWYTDAEFKNEATYTLDEDGNKVYDKITEQTYYAKWEEAFSSVTPSSLTFEPFVYGETPKETQSLTVVSNDVTTPSAIGFESEYFDITINDTDETKITVTPTAGLDAGTYTEDVIITTEDEAAHFVTVTLTVNPKNIEITGLEAKDRVYNGTDTVELTGGELSGIINGDDVQAIVPTTGIAASANAGTHAVTFADITLNGADAGNYTLVNPSVTVEIGKAEQAIGYTITSIEKTMDDGAFINELIEDIVDDTIVYSSSEESVATVDADGTVTIKGAGTTTITATAEETTNYNAKTAYYTLTVLPTMQRVDPVGTIGYIVEHYKDGVFVERECLTGETDEVVTAVPKIYDGYTYNADKSIVSGTLQPITTEDDVVILKLYYDKNVEPENDTPISNSGSSGFTGSYNYPVSTPEVDNGDVKLSDSNATEGESVTATVTPDNGYGVAEVIVTDEDGNIIPVEFIGNGQYTFTMPDGEVDIEVICKPAITMKIGDTVLNIFGKTMQNDVAPTIGEGNRTMLPIRAVANALGADVYWDADNQKVIIVKDGKVIEVFIGKDYAFVDGERIELDAKAYIENDRTYLQLRFVTEALDAEVIWDAATRTVTIIPE